MAIDWDTASCPGRFSQNKNLATETRFVVEKRDRPTLQLRLHGAVCQCALEESTTTLDFNNANSMHTFVGSPALETRSHRELRFKSSFRIIDSEISFMDVRLSWLSRCIVRYASSSLIFNSRCKIPLARSISFRVSSLSERTTFSLSNRTTLCSFSLSSISDFWSS